MMCNLQSVKSPLWVPAEHQHHRQLCLNLNHTVISWKIPTCCPSRSSPWCESPSIRLDSLVASVALQCLKAGASRLVSSSLCYLSCFFSLEPACVQGGGRSPTFINFPTLGHSFLISHPLSLSCPHMLEDSHTMGSRSSESETYELRGGARRRG